MQAKPIADDPTLRELSSIAAENNPNRPAFGNGISGRTVTWAEFDEQSAREANALREHVGQGDRIAYLCEASVEQTVSWYAGLRAGCVVSNLHVRNSPESLRSCVDSLRPRVLVVDEERSALVESEIYDAVSTEVDAVYTTGTPRTAYERPLATVAADYPAVDPDVRVDPDDVAVVMWTSGTTGKPKGWCHTNRTLIRRATKLAHKKQTTRRTRVQNVFSPSFAAWYSSVLPPMLANGATYYQPEWDPESFVEGIEAREVTTTLVVPTMWREVLRLDDLDDYDLRSLRTIETAGEPFDVTTLENLRERVCSSVAQSYAATEVTGTNITDEEMRGDRIESVGKPLLGVRIRVVERDGAVDDVLPPGEVGEIVVKNPDAAVRVWGDPTRSDDAFEDGWWRSGDLGYKDDDGYLYVGGRDDNMILSKGIKVFPTPVEERLNAHPGVVESAVVGVEDEEYGQRVTAVVALSDGDVTAEDLDAWCLESEDLSRYERPRAYHFREGTLPRTASDKLDRSAIRESLDDS